ncbi:MULTISPECIES: hypothetical protein [unclassified Mucilaginibacter]|uniref:hypothetical protein n=1 Tax=unclassified Mucilaginibacter TaxID=2617802 RepID=UPI0025E5966B|nr:MULTISPECIES: hypothetical protein [unclassified Mucilaginibacter]
MVLTFLFQKVLLTKNVYYNSLQDQLDNSRIDQLFDSQAKYAWFGYVVIPIWLLIKITIITLCLQAGIILQNIKLSFKKTFTIAITAEFVFLLSIFIKFFWFFFVKTNYTIADVQQFYPISALNLFDVKTISPLLVYPLQTLNIFEVLYWFILAAGISQALKTDMDKGVRIVFVSYIPALVVWLCCVVFLTVNLTPAS